jgi:hypothetical protein
MREGEQLQMDMFGSATGMLITAEISGELESRRHTKTYSKENAFQ